MTDELATSPLPLWQCHKKVHAAKIEDIEPLEDGGARLVLGELAVVVDDAFVAKHEPHVNGYFVRYEDGYESFSPALAFESGYTRCA